MHPQKRRMARQALIRMGLLVTLVVLALSACGGGGSAQEGGNAPSRLPPRTHLSRLSQAGLHIKPGRGTNCPTKCTWCALMAQTITLLSPTSRVVRLIPTSHRMARG
jgi:hypothetical protein